MVVHFETSKKGDNFSIEDEIDSPKHVHYSEI